MTKFTTNKKKKEIKEKKMYVYVESPLNFTGKNYILEHDYKCG